MARRSVYSTVPPANSSSCASGDDEDECQRAVALSSLFKRPRTNHKELQEFRASVESDQQKLKTLLEQRVRQTEQASKCYQDKFAEAISKALRTPNRPVEGAPSTISETMIARNAVFKAVASVLMSSKHLIAEYDRLDRMIAGIRDAESDGIAEAWTDEVDSTARLLKVGAGTSIKHVKKVLGADSEVDHLRKIGSETMEALEKMELNYALHKSLQDAERGVNKMAKSLPEDEAGLLDAKGAFLIGSEGWSDLHAQHVVGVSDM